jgi:hypothetical protein
MFRGTQYYLIDIGIVCGHFVLQAEDLGLGTCWIGWFNEKAVKSILEVPQNKKIDILLALGYYDREKLGAEHGREARTIHGLLEYSPGEELSSERRFTLRLKVLSQAIEAMRPSDIDELIGLDAYNAGQLAKELR